jgi:type II secretory pathway component GspD/PulD (secretin)
MREKGKARSISRTQLLTVNNLAAQMTDTQSYHAKVIGTEVATLQEVSAGTTLQLKPRILPALSPDIPNQVWLSMKLDDGGFESIAVDSMPMTRSSTLTTQTAIFEDESIMLAGYLREIEENAGWGIPFLRDIPIIGWLFGGKSTRKETVQRMFVITPHIVDLDKETLIRLQATHLRDISVARELQKDADEEEKGEEEDADEEEDAEEEEEDAEKEESSPGADEAQRKEEVISRKAAEAQSEEYNGAKLEPIVIEVAAPAEKTEAFPPAPELDLQGVSVEK